MQKDHIHSPQPDNSPAADQLLTTNEVAEKLGISRRSFYRRKKEIEPLIPSLKIGKKSIRYRLSDVQDFITRGGVNVER